MEKKILLITSIVPIPSNGGEKLRVKGLIEVLNMIYDYKNVDIIIINNVQIEETIKYFKNKIIAIPKKENILNKLFNLDLFLTYYKNDIQKNIKYKYNKIILDYGFLGNYINPLKKYAKQIVISTHNSQADLTKQMPAKSFYKMITKYKRYIFENLHEKIYFRNADKIIVVSENDYTYHQKYNDNIILLPNYIEDIDYCNYKREDYFIFVANFNAYMNYEGLKWFLTSVNKYVTRKVLIIGKGSKESYEKIGIKYDNINVVGEVESTTEYFKTATASIIPLLHGSGTRLKCIESMAYGTPVISTSKGSEGIESKNIIIENDPIKFAKIMNEYKFDEISSKELHKNYMNKYSYSAASIIISEM